MPVKGSHRQFCLRGHDTSICGRTKSNGCRTCANIAKRERHIPHPRIKKQFCINGHDISIVGRDKRGACIGCRKKGHHIKDSNKSIQFCVHGHDTWICARDNHGTCNDCVSIRKRKYYQDNPNLEQIKERNKRNSKISHQRLREFIDKQKAFPCVDCGIKYPPYVMQFDHRPGSMKLFDISKPSTRKISALAEEITKCDLVCANCHAERTHQRLMILHVTTN